VQQETAKLRTFDSCHLRAAYQSKIGIICWHFDPDLLTKPTINAHSEDRQIEFGNPDIAADSASISIDAAQARVMKMACWTPSEPTRTGWVVPMRSATSFCAIPARSLALNNKRAI